MRAILKDIYSLEHDLQTYQPEPADNFDLLLRAMIGPEGKEGSDSFDILVVTPRWLLENIHRPKWGYQMLIVPEYNLAKIIGIIEEYCRSCEGNDWESIAKLLSRIGNWEFENYRK